MCRNRIYTCGIRYSGIQNVAVGEVWLAGGQSNMELALKDSENGIKVSEEYTAEKTYGFIKSQNVLC